MNSEAEANADVANPNTSTKAEDISKDVANNCCTFIFIW
jgi:hypothetical protein